MNLRRLPRYLWAQWVRPLALPLLLVAAAKSAVADINYVPSGSMHPTLVEGDVVFVNKLAYDLRVPFTFTRVAHWAEPRRGDVVVCFEPTDGTRLVKRVIGLPGDTVELRRDVLLLNGTAQSYTALPPARSAALDPRERAAAVFAEEQLTGHPHALMVLPRVPARRDFGPVTLGRDDYLMLGDNRDNSRDSRYFGVMPREKIIGRVQGIAVSADPQHWLRPRFDRFFRAIE